MSKTLDYGLFFLRLSVGLTFFWSGLQGLDLHNIKLRALAALLCGGALVIGLLVRPAVIFMLAMIVAVYVSKTKLSINLANGSLAELLALIGFLVGGGGSFLALGSAIGGLKGKWYQ